MGLRRVVVALILLSTAAFVVGAVLERSSSEAAPSGEVTQGEGGEETHTDEEGASEATTSSEHSEEGTILGVDPESTPILVIAVIGSLALALGVWLRPTWGWLLVITALGMAVFTVLDIREVAHQVSESNTGLGLIAIAVTFLHAAASVGAVLLWRSSLPISQASATQG